MTRTAHLVHGDLLEAHYAQEQLRHFLDIKPIAMIGYEEDNRVVLSLVSYKTAPKDAAHMIVFRSDFQLGPQRLLDDGSDIIHQHLVVLPVSPVQTPPENWIANFEPRVGRQSQSLPESALWPVEES